LGTHRTQWHVLFYAALQEHGSPGTEALAEVLLSKDPQRGDILLLRKRDVPGADVPGLDAQARTLKAFWQLVEREVLIEYKSPSRPPRSRDLARLVGYGGQTHHLRHREIGPFDNLLLCLVVTSLTAPFRKVLGTMKAAMKTVAPGYLLVETRPYRLLVIDLSEVVQAGGDEWMSIFVPSTMLTAAARQWLETHMPAKNVPPDQQLEGHSEVLARLLQATPPKQILRAAGAERLLNSLPPRRRLAGLTLEQRLADLPPEQRLLAMPDSALRVLPDEYLRTLPDDVQAAIRKRIAGV
jgi:hypothetical protein